MMLSNSVFTLSDFSKKKDLINFVDDGKIENLSLSNVRSEGFNHLPDNRQKVAAVSGILDE